MNKFNTLYNLIIEEHPIFKKTSKEDIKQRQEEKWQKDKDKLQRWIDEEVKKGKAKKNDDGSYDYNGTVHLFSRELTKIPIKFNNITGDFNCNMNKLTTLENCPKKVTGKFMCNINKLTSLEHCPIIVGTSFECFMNNLTSLKGCPNQVVNFICRDNNLTSLKGCPSRVIGDFDCSNQKNGHKFTIEDVQKVCKVSGEIYV